MSAWPMRRGMPVTSTLPMQNARRREEARGGEGRGDMVPRLRRGDRTRARVPALRTEAHVLLRNQLAKGRGGAKGARRDAGEEKRRGDRDGKNTSLQRDAQDEPGERGCEKDGDGQAGQ